MLSNAYLYGEDVIVPPLDNHMALQRIELLEEHIELLYEVHYTKRDEVKIREINKAISFWTQLSRMN